MTTLTDIIEVQISRETTPVSRAGFNTPLFIGTHANFKERARVYTSIEALGEDFGPTSSVYTAAQRMFGQELRPSQIVIGRRQIAQFTVSVTSVQNTTQYSMTISDTPYTYTSEAVATSTAIAAGLKASYDVSPHQGVTVTDNLDGTLTVASTVDWSLKVGDGLQSSAAPSTETWVEALQAVEAENSNWFGLTTETHIEADVLALAAAIEARKKIYGVSTQDAATKTSVDTDLASKLKALGYDKTFVMFSENADSEYPECALMAYQLQEQPGSNTWAYKDLTGVTVSKLGGTATANLENKYVITFEEIGGARATTSGRMIGGEFIDVMVFALWLEARMTERIWFRLANSKKIPYTQAGATIIEAEIRAQLAEGVRVGGIAPAPQYQVFVPNVLELEPNLRASRVFEGITFEARLAGAIHKVKIRGTVTV
jgi:hypothetical protein